MKFKCCSHCPIISNAGWWIILRDCYRFLSQSACDLLLSTTHFENLSNKSFNLSFVWLHVSGNVRLEMQLVQSQAAHSRRIFQSFLLVLRSELRNVGNALIMQAALSIIQCSTRWPQKWRPRWHCRYSNQRRIFLLASLLLCLSSTQPLSDTWETILHRCFFISF